MSKRSGRKSYSAELREKAVRLVTERGYTHAQVAEQLGCSLESVRRWKEDAKRKLDPELAIRIELEEYENKRLRNEVKRLTTEVEILKKAAAPCFYSTAQRRLCSYKIRLDQRTTRVLSH